MPDHFFSDMAYSEVVQAVNASGDIRNLSDLNELNDLVKLIADHVWLDDLLTEAQVSEYKWALDQIVSSEGLGLERQQELYAQTLENLLNQVQYLLERSFGRADHLIFRTLNDGERNPVKLNDSILRSSAVSGIGRLTDQLQAQLVRSRGIVHKIAGLEREGPIEVFNPGEAIGTLRIAKNSMELGPDDIAVYEQVPAQSGAVRAMITINSGGEALTPPTIGQIP